MSFFNIVPRDEGFLKDMSNAIPLNVIMEDGVSTTPDININVTELSKGYDNFYNTSGDGVNFKIKIIIRKTDKVKNDSLVDWLDKHIRAMTPFYISTDAIDLEKFQNKPFIIINNENRKQTYPNDTVWELEFRTYNQVIVHKFYNDNIGIKNALKKATPNPYAKLKKCNYKDLVYSKKKKNVKCVKILQEVLYKKKFLKKKSYIDGWYNKVTKQAVKNFQISYNSKHLKAKTINGAIMTENGLVANPKTKGSTVVKLYGSSKVLPTNGKVDKATWKALCEK